MDGSPLRDAGDSAVHATVVSVHLIRNVPQRIYLYGTTIILIMLVIAALATVGLVGQEGRIMRLNLIPLIYYATFGGFWALVFVYVLPDIFPVVFDVF